METRYFVKKKTLLGLSKLTLLASELQEKDLGRQLGGKTPPAFCSPATQLQRCER